MNVDNVVSVLQKSIEAIEQDHRQPICINIRIFGFDEMHKWLKPYMLKYKPPGIEGHWFDHSTESGTKRISILKSIIKDLTDETSS